MVDHVHILISSDHVRLGITVTPGVRAVYCYNPMVQPKFSAPLQVHQDIPDDWVMKTSSNLADRAPFGDGRVTRGSTYDMWFLPPEMTRAASYQVGNKDIRTTTCHATLWLSATRNLDNSGMLHERLLIAHGGVFTEEDSQGCQKSRWPCFFSTIA